MSTKRPRWTLLSQAISVWSEDDATVSQSDHETIERAFKRIYGVPMPDPIEVWSDDEESSYRLLPMGIVACDSYPGNSQIAVWPHPGQWRSLGDSRSRASAQLVEGATKRRMGKVAEATLTTVRELGFDNALFVSGPSTEKVFFLGPCMKCERERGAHATTEAILDFIAYYENQIQVAKEYLLSGRNNKTHEWASSVPAEGPSVEAKVVVQEILRSNGLLDFSKVDEGARSVDTLIAQSEARKTS